MVLTSEEMLVVLLDMEDNSASQLDLGEEVEVSQDEEDLALRLELRDHELLVGEQVVFLGVTLVHTRVHIAGVQDFTLAVYAVAKREDVVAALYHEEWEVEVGQLEVNVSDLTLSELLRWPCLLIELLTIASLVDGNFKLACVCSCLRAVGASS